MNPESAFWWVALDTEGYPYVLLPRARSALVAAGLKWEDVRRMTPEQLLAIPKLGKKSYWSVSEALRAYDIIDAAVKQT